MGLLDFSFPDDPQKQALLMMGLGLLGARKDKSVLGNIGDAGLLGMQAYGQGQKFQMQKQQAEQEAKLRQMQMDDMQRKIADEQAVRSAYSQNIQPGMPQMQPTDYETPSGPAGPASMNMQGLQQSLMSLGPVGMPHLAQLSAMNAKNYQKVGPGESLFDMSAPGGPRSVASTPDKPPPGFLRNPDGSLKADPEWLAAQERIRAAGKPEVRVNTNLPPLENSEQKGKGEINVKYYGGLQEAAANARKENALLTGLEKIDLDTGKTTPANATVSAWIASLGGGPRFKEVAAKGQSFTNFATELVMQKQLAQKGPQTESDARRLEQTVANLGNTPEANKLLISFSKAQNQRAIDEERFYSEWWKKNKTYEGAADAWLSEKGATSIWDSPDLKKYQSASGNIGWSATRVK